MPLSVIPNANLGGGVAPIHGYGPLNRSIYSRTLYVGTTVVSVASKLALNATARPAADRQQTVAALDSVIPIPYGRARLGALLAHSLQNSGGQWVYWVIWGLGPIDAIESVSMNDAPIPQAVATRHYTGAAGQTVDADLKAAFAFTLGAGAPAFDETLDGIAYSVFIVPPSLLSGDPQFNAVVRGRQVYDPRTTTTAWSRNPALILADFLASGAYGDGKAPDWDSVAAIADDCDSLVGGETKRISDMVVDVEQPTSTWLETMRTAAACFIVPQAGVVKLIADSAASSVASYDHANGNVMGVSNEKQADPRSLPTVVEIVYTDTSQLPWRDISVFAKRPGVGTTTPYRKSTVRMPWITRASQANREAIERLNKLWLRSVSLDLDLMDEGIIHEPGDVIDLTWPDSGYVALPLRVAKVAPTDDGWKLTCTKEDAGAYSDAVIAGPTIPTTDLPIPTAPPAITGLTVSEDVYQVQTGLFGSRLVATWDVSPFPFVDGYQVTITQNGVAKDGPLVASGNSHVSKQLTEGLLYVVSVAIVSSTGAIGPETAASITTNGKLAKPSDVPAFDGFEVGGEVRLSWTPATDLDLTAHEIRYGDPAGTWETATLLDRVATPAVRYNTKVVPAGTWRFWIKGLDSVRTPAFPHGQESVNATHKDITVTTDDNAFVALDEAFSSPLLLNMTSAPGGGYVTAFGDAWNTLFSAALSTYTSPLYTYHTAGTSELLSEMVDVGTAITGDWTVNPTWQDLAGTAVVQLELNSDGGEPAKTITNATNATPIVITCAAHGYASGNEVVIAGVSNTGSSTNVALASNGGVASASATQSPQVAANANNGDHTGSGWLAGSPSGWYSGDSSTTPQWLEIDFASTQTIDTVIVYQVQDNFQNPIEPTDSTTGTQYLLLDFQIEYWDGATWQNFGAAVVSNDLIKRTVTASPVTTSKVRVFITRTPDNHSRVVELEAWTASVADSAANGRRLVTVIDANTFSLQDQLGADVAGNGTYTGGGTASRWVWNAYTSLPARATARFARYRVTTTGTVEVSSLGKLSCNVVTRREGGTVTTSVSGPTTIQLSNSYTKALSITATAQGTAARSVVYDNVDLAAGTFDLYAFDASGTQQSATVAWEFSGV